MLERGQDPPLLAEPPADLGAGPARLDHLQRHQPPEVLAFLLGQIDASHAPAPQLPQDAVRTDLAGTDRTGGRLFPKAFPYPVPVEQRLQIGRRVGRDQVPCVGPDQRRDRAPQLLVVAAGLAQERFSLHRLAFQRLRQDLLDLAPPLRRHAECYLSRQDSPARVAGGVYSIEAPLRAATVAAWCAPSVRWRWSWAMRYKACAGAPWPFAAWMSASARRASPMR